MKLSNLFRSIVLPCKHQYHSKCLKLQLENNILKCAECSKEYYFSEDCENILIDNNLNKICNNIVKCFDK